MRCRVESKGRIVTHKDDAVGAAWLVGSIEVEAESSQRQVSGKLRMKRFAIKELNLKL